MARVKKFLSRYVFSKATGRYFRRSDARLVPPSEIEKEIDRLVARSEKQLQVYGEQLDDADISLRQWQNLVADEVRLLHTATAAASRGGLRNLDERAKREIKREIETQLTYLRNFALQVDTGNQEINGTFYNRLKGYARTAKATYTNQYHLERVRMGGRRARRVLGVAEHCRTSRGKPGCFEEAAKGFVNAEDVVPIGKCVCLYNCHCRIELDNEPTRVELQKESERIAKRLARQRRAA